MISMPVGLSLKKMSRAEKLRAMEAIWTDLTQDEERFESPNWHGDALREAEHAFKTGKASFRDWETVKKRIRTRARRLV